MKMMKRIFLITAVITALILSVTAMASDTHLNTVTVDFVVADIPIALEGDVVLNLYDESGSQLLATNSYPYTRGTGWFSVNFEVPSYSVGTKFKLQLAGGAQGIKFGDVTAYEHIVETYLYAGEDGSAQYQTHFYMELVPTWYKQAEIKIPAVKNTEYYHCVIGDEVYVTKDLLEILEINCTTDFDAEKPSFTLSDDSKSYIAKFYLNDIYATFGGIGENLPVASFAVDNMPYVPLSRIAQYFDCDYTVLSDSTYNKSISMDISKYSEAYKNAIYVNGTGISSRTDYLIWISKKDYKVSLFTGEKGNWRCVWSAPCAIGAPSTPTVEGSFEYIDTQSRWQYDEYYCGPIMRFYNGYALHSTLIRNNGTPFDDRVGVKISHGCVRLHPNDINWLHRITPMYTRILVTG